MPLLPFMRRCGRLSQQLAVVFIVNLARLASP
jgi:hypothetical protein